MKVEGFGLRVDQRAMGVSAKLSSRKGASPLHEHVRQTHPPPWPHVHQVSIRQRQSTSGLYVVQIWPCNVPACTNPPAPLHCSLAVRLPGIGVSAKLSSRKGARSLHENVRQTRSSPCKRDWFLIAKQAAPAPHLARPEGCAAPRIVLVTVPHVSRSCEQFLDSTALLRFGSRVS